VKVPGDKPVQWSPVFERINLERLQRSKENTDSAQRAVVRARRLVKETQELIERVQQRRRKAS
jgi:hypothetical protein